jgi:sugar phosphate isomerase/epimerase
MATQLHYLPKPLEVRFGDNDIKMATGKGTINLLIHKRYTISIANVYFVPRLAKNLLFVSEATSNGVGVEFHSKHAIIHHKLPTGEVIETIYPKLRRLYHLQTVDNTIMEVNMVSTYPDQVNLTLLWHHRLGHLRLKSMQQTSQTHQLMEGIPRKQFHDVPICEGCIYGKQS